MITPPITKNEARNLIDERDEGEIQKWVTIIDTRLRTSWKGEALFVRTDVMVLSDHVVKRLMIIFGDAGWAISYVEGSYVEGGSSQRDGEWNGHFTIE